MTGPDERAIELLRQQRDRGTIPRAVTIWFYGDCDELSDLKASLEQAGWDAIEPEPCDRTYMIRAEREQEATEAAMDGLLREIEDMIAFTDVVFDGWETTVELGQ